MNQTALATAFRAQLRSAVGADARVVFENDAPKNIARPYYKATLLPGENETPSYGSAFVRAVGIYQVSVVTDAGVGETLASTLADNLLTLFPRGLTFMGETAIIVIEKAWRSPAIQSVDSYIIPVSVRYWADMSN